MQNPARKVQLQTVYTAGELTGQKRRGASAGQHARLNYLHSLLGVTHFGDEVRYQLLHRTASALLAAREFHAGSAVMLIHAFGTPLDRRAEFDVFVSAMQAETVTENLFRVSKFSKPELFLAWCNGDERFLQVELEREVFQMTE